MPRYFLEVAYKGTRYSGFQVQLNANTVQAEVEKAFHILHRLPNLPSPQNRDSTSLLHMEKVPEGRMRLEGPGVRLTGSSRTDAGVHALQNYFHFDFDGTIHPQFLYKMNALLPADIVLKNIHRVPVHAHARYDAISRSYEYRIYRTKNPFLQDIAFYYPYKLDIVLLQETAAIIKGETNFFAFAKTNSQVKNYRCLIYASDWLAQDEMLFYRIEANRFLRGMVRLLTAAQLSVARGKFSLEWFRNLFFNNEKCGRSVPAVGLFLKAVQYPSGYFNT